ncbi:MAG: alpha/beta hydrolase [Treponema sp.]|jgi:alpha-beta hydrolase superfamily lysophospholipase|nr:alpha/beta hydrolase [Treponema sp.]
MVEMSLWLDCDDGTRLFTRRWRPPGGRAVRGIVHLVHGMAEHSGRYAFLAEKLTARGFELWAADQRGHGKTADPAKNDPGKGGLLGHSSDRDGFFRVVKDISIINRHIAASVTAENRTLPPFFIIGHSWGSFLVQAFIESLGPSAKEAVVPVAGAVLSGTRGPGSADVVFGAPVVKLITAFKGVRRSSKLVTALSFGPYNRHFRPNRSAFDWLSRDEKLVNSFVDDPLCGKPCSLGFFRDMMKGLGSIHRKAAIKAVPADLPVYIFCGSADPVGAMGVGPTKLVNAYRTNGVTDLEFVIYPDARHEPLNETNREEVAEDLCDWLLRHS